MDDAPSLVGIAEIAKLLGVSKQRVSVLASQPKFPIPVARLKMGPVYRQRDIERFKERRDRKPGRPPKGATSG